MALEMEYVAPPHKYSNKSVLGPLTIGAEPHFSQHERVHKITDFINHLDLVGR